MAENSIYSAHPASAPTGHTRGTHRNFRGMHILESDEPLVATLEPLERAVLGTTGKYEQRAQTLGIPLGTLRSRLHRARAKLVNLRTQVTSPRS
jgi:hypothetical protein